MTARRDPSEDRHDTSPTTLGDLLYADKTKVRVSEEEWTDLVRSIALGDQRALAALYARANRVAFTLIMRITNDRETAEEVTVDIFHDVWRRAADYDPASGSVLGWIMNQARSRAIDRIRFDQRKKRVPPDSAGRVPSAAGSAVDEPLGREDRRRVLHNALTLLTSAERQAIEAAFFREMTYAEVAERLGHPLGTIKTRIRSGLGKLRESLARQGKEL